MSLDAADESPGQDDDNRQKTEGVQTNARTLHRNRSGTKAEDWSPWPTTPLEEMDSAFSVQQYIGSLVRADPANVSDIVKLPQNQDADVWQYEHLRQFCIELNGLVLLLESECTPELCPSMKAEEWMFLCATHPQPQPCCAIDYTVHTLDGATALLCSTRYFPSRISIPESSIRHFQSIARRLYRIFAHAWYHHKEAFYMFENETHLHERFIMFANKTFKLVPDKLIITPNTDSTSPT
ncbi:preimplantation protein [Cladochytrium replicatum]|nr:preimplantation protein [Cladochytrium replicatum]